MTVHASFEWFAGAYVTLLFFGLVIKYLVPAGRSLAALLRDVRQLRVDVARMKRAQGIRLSRPERLLLEQEGDDDDET